MYIGYYINVTRIKTDELRKKEFKKCKCNNKELDKSLIYKYNILVERNKEKLKIF